MKYGLLSLDHNVMCSDCKQKYNKYKVLLNNSNKTKWYKVREYNVKQKLTGFGFRFFVMRAYEDFKNVCLKTRVMPNVADKPSLSSHLS